MVTQTREQYGLTIFAVVIVTMALTLFLKELIERRSAERRRQEKERIDLAVAQVRTQIYIQLRDAGIDVPALLGEDSDDPEDDEPQLQDLA